MAVLNGYRVVYLDPGRFHHFDCPGYNEVKIAVPWKIGQAIEEISPDHIHIATEGPMGLCARQYLDKRGYRYNTAYHTKFPEGLRKLFFIPEVVTWPLVRWFHKHSGRVLTTTDSMVQQLRSKGFDGDVVPWTRGVDRETFYPLENHRVKSKVMLCVSRVSKEKNLEDFFRLEYPGYKKIMVGDGPMKSEYEYQYPDVKFVGYKTGAELAEYYRMADVFVFPSRWETFGIVMIEAMACGTPVAAYDCQGPADVIQEGITGCINQDLHQAVKDALMLDREQVYLGSLHWSWTNAWEIFQTNLIPATNRAHG
jgi:glycosyltransferase involved in cell wall biosynthesis